MQGGGEGEFRFGAMSCQSGPEKKYFFVIRTDEPEATCHFLNPRRWIFHSGARRQNLKGALLASCMLTLRNEFIKLSKTARLNDKWN